ncbi:MAG: peptidylprolyl isomerase [Parvularculaceae bacterium]|nr:peptidylprolyl isomerase [Parvularculaceae bacterium]
MSENAERGDADPVKTPDGRQFQQSNPAGRAAGAIGRATMWLARQLWRGVSAVVVAVARGFGKLVLTIWRLAEALDSALWRGFKLSLAMIGSFLAATGRAAFAAFSDLFHWLPSRWGRAYTAGSAVWLIIAGLWVADEIRNAERETTAFDQFFRPPVDNEDPIVARMDARYIHLSEVEAAARAAGQLRPGENLTIDAAFSRELVKAYVEQRLLAKAAIDDGMQRDPAVARRLSAARDRILGAAYMESRIAAATTPDKVERLYESQADVTRLGDEVRARHIVVATEEEARAIIKELTTDGDFASIARARSLDRSTAPLGGEIGWFTKDMMTPILSRAAFSTLKGEIAPPFFTEFGWHVLEVEDRRASQGVGFEAVSDNIRRFLTLREISDTLDDLSEGEDVVYYPPAGERAASAN